MSRTAYFLTAFIICILLVGLNLHGSISVDDDSANYPTAPPDDVKAAATGNNAFAVNLYAKLSSSQGNLLFSPYSIDTALAMAYGGARGNTAAQMAQTMKFSMPDGRLHPAMGALAGALSGEAWVNGKQLFDLSVADAVWTQQGFHFDPTYINLLQTNYATELHQSDFAGNPGQACNDINRWVGKKTKGMIPAALGQLDPSTRLVLVNAIYFKGKWQLQFKKEETSDQPFHLDASSSVSSPLMFEEVNCPASQNADFQAVELPYQGDKLSMVVILPRTVDGLEALEKNLSPDYLDRLIGGMGLQDVNVHLPKFKMSGRFDLVGVLGSMGMSDAFNGESADFSGITTQQRLYIGSAIHLAKMDVNEEGTEAAAVTVLGFRATIAMPPPPPPMEFRADHPFLFMIRDNSSGAILFMGRLVNPQNAV